MEQQRRNHRGRWHGQGYLAVTSGGSVLSGSGSLGEGAAGYGEVTLGGGAGISSWTNTGNLLVGNRGGVLLTVQGGGTVSSAVGIFGNVAGSTGNAVIGNDSGDASWINSSAINVGYHGAATLNIGSGGLVKTTGLEGGNGLSSVNLNGGTLRIRQSGISSNQMRG